MSWAGAASTYFIIDPREELAVVAMSQVIVPRYFGAVEQTIYTLIYSAMTKSYA